MTFVVQPKSYGDGSEYHIQLESIYSNSWFNQTEENITKLNSYAENTELGSDFFTENRFAGYYEAKEGNLHGYHFWLYSLTNLPIKIFTEIIGINPLTTFQVFNSLIFLFLSLFILKSYKKNTSLIFFTTFANFSIWFLHWNHPEYWSFALVLTSLILFSGKKINLAIFLSAIASTQNPPIIFLSTLFLILSLFKTIITNSTTKQKIKSIIIPLTAISISLLPYIFYYIYFGTPNLISKVGGTDFSLVSFKRILELFFDPGLGMLFFQPLATVIIFAVLIFSAYRIMNSIRSKTDFKTIINSKYFFYITLFIVLVLMLAFSASTTNWNHGSSGPSRYVIWSILPIGIFFILELIQNLDKFRIINTKRFIVAILVLSIIYSSTILFLGGGLIPNGRFGNGGFNIFQRITMDYFPEFYNPDIQIFESRAECNFTVEGCEDNVWIYYKNVNCRKVLVEKNNVEILNYKCGYIGSLDLCHGAFCYFSY